MNRLYFAFGSNMHRGQMAVRCPTARAMGPAVLGNWRFLITRDGYASIEPEPGARVHGVLWRCVTRDILTLDTYEDVPGGWYRQVRVNVLCNRRLHAALAYRCRIALRGRPARGYHDQVVVPAARDWGLPADYIGELEAWLG
jgi:AIG2-like family